MKNLLLYYKNCLVISDIFKLDGNLMLNSINLYDEFSKQFN